jgi:hypothetical protein
MRHVGVRQLQQDVAVTRLGADQPDQIPSAKPAEIGHELGVPKQILAEPPDDPSRVPSLPSRHEFGQVDAGQRLKRAGR